MEGGGTDPDGGLSTGGEDGFITGRDPMGVVVMTGVAGGDRMGTVFAVNSLSREGMPLFFGSGVGRAAGFAESVESAAGGGAEGGREGAGISRVGSGDVLWARALTSEARETFFVLCGGAASGEVADIDEPDFLAVEGTVGAFGPIKFVFFAVKTPCGGEETFSLSCGFDGRWVTPGGASGARLCAGDTSASARIGSDTKTPVLTGSGCTGSGVGGSLSSTSLNGAQSCIPSYWAESVGDKSPSARCCLTSFSE